MAKNAEQDALNKEAQALLKEAQKKLNEAAKLADKGGFSLDFMGGSYSPKRTKKLDALLREDATAQAKRWTTDWDTLSPEEQEEVIQENIDDLAGQDLHEGQEPGEWWLPSNCW